MHVTSNYYISGSIVRAAWGNEYLYRVGRKELEPNKLYLKFEKRHKAYSLSLKQTLQLGVGQFGPN